MTSGNMGAVIGRPVFLVGTGRSGTTLLNRILGSATDAAYFGTYDNRFGPRRGFIDLKRASQWLPSRYANTPTEPYRVLDAVCPGFSTSVRSLQARDATPRVRAGLTTLLETRMAKEHRDHLVLKWTGWSHIGLMSEVFPDAVFVHVHRHGLAVAGSLMRQPWWQGWAGPDQWRWGSLSDRDRQAWEASGRSFAVLAALQWKVTFEEIEASSADLPAEHYCRVALEDLQTDPVSVARLVSDFSGLPWRSRGAEAISGHAVRRQRPDMWRTDLGVDAELAEAAVAGALVRQAGLANVS